MKTLIAVPCMSTMPYEFTLSILALNKGENVTAKFQPNTLVYDARNLLSLIAIENDFDRVMWFDSDMVFTPETMQVLSADLDDIPADMVTGLYFKRREPHSPVIFDELDAPAENKNGIIEKRVHDYVHYPKNTIFSVRGCGFGCCMTSVKLLKDVWDKFGPAFTPYAWAGEDISFCHRVNQLGYKIYCDSRISCGHVGSKIYTESDFHIGGDTH